MSMWQGWGMADGLHAMVFVDNHDNQRTDGGVLTAQNNDYHYKLGAGFMLAHDYGFKRVMSSYSFNNNDQVMIIVMMMIKGMIMMMRYFIQGPPGNAPASGACGSGWMCEHRWSSIANMVKFANAVVGTGVENWQAGYNYLGFSRGNKGFFAMGDLNKEFYTGMPDGEYCDIIHDCQNKVRVGETQLVVI